MKLNVIERLTALGLLPKEGNFLTLKILRDLKDKLGFSDEELTRLEIKQDKESSMVTWNKEKDKPVEIELGIKETELIKDELEKLDKEKRLTEQHFSLYEKFKGDE